MAEIKKESRKEIKKERIVEEEDSITELKMPKDDFSDREYKSESTFTFPIDFDDDEVLSPKMEEKPVVREVIREEYRPVNKVPEKIIKKIRTRISIFFKELLVFSDIEH